MKRWVLLGVSLVFGVECAYGDYDDNLEWKYDMSGRPADAVSESPGDFSAGVDARANVAWTLLPSGDEKGLEVRPWWGSLLGLFEFQSDGFLLIFR